MRRLLVACLLVCPVFALAQSPERISPAAERQIRDAPDSPAPGGLAVRRVILYKTGVGYFEHLGNVRDRQQVTVRFTSAQLNDVLKSLTVLDLGKGQVTGISYNSVAPLEQRLGALRLPLGASTTTRDVLASLRGARIEVASGAGTAEGRLLGIEQRTAQRGPETMQVDVLSLITDAGELRTFELSPAVRVRVVERDLRQEVGRYLDLVGSTREQDVRNMVISTSGTGDRPLFVSYISEVPIWKSTYRLVLPSQGKPFLQGWAIVDNTIGEDWRNVDLSLVAGAPQSFIQNISQPYYARRPVVPLPAAAQMTPQTHSGALAQGEAGVMAGGSGVAELAASPLSRSARIDGRGVPGGTVGGGVGGFAGAPPPPPAAPMPVYDQARDAIGRADAAALGDLFEYRVKEPITLRKNQSALVPIINADVAVEKVSLWNRGAGSGRPVRAVWLTNATGLTLDGGSITVVDGNAFAGEGLVEPLKAGERRLISYAADLGVLVDARRQQGELRVSKVRARDGIIIQENEERATWTYRVRNENATPTTLVIEHRMSGGWKLAEGQQPAESTVDAERFRVVLPPGKETVHEVREVRGGQSRIVIADLDDDMLSRMVATGAQLSAFEPALRPVIAKRAGVAALQRRVEALESERGTIVNDQQRLRENMKALRGSAEEKQLLQRYTRQLDEQETRLDALAKELAAAAQQLSRAREELSALIAKVSFEVAVPAPGR